MGKGSVFSAEFIYHRIAGNGVSVRQLADPAADSHHLYFTNSGWYDEDRRLVFVSSRYGSTDLFSLELSSGIITQLIDEKRTTTDLMFSSLNPRKPEVYFWRSGDLIALDLESLHERFIYRTPAGFSNNLTSVTADGANVCTVIYEDLRHRFAVDLLNGYVGFEEYWAARPLSSVMLIDTQTGVARTLLTKQTWIGHVNASPRVPHLLSYCHEGPWGKVDHRIWGLDCRSGNSWKIRPVREGESVGHEYWLSDGQTLGFHGATAEKGFYFGATAHDNTRDICCPLSIKMDHVHSNDLSFIVGDGNSQKRFLHYWNASERGQHGPIPILRHDCNAKTQARHVHPRLSPDSRSVIFVSDLGGRGQLYMLDVDEVLEKCPPTDLATEKGEQTLMPRAMVHGIPGIERALDPQHHHPQRAREKGYPGVYFVDLDGNAEIGSSLLRTYQLHQIVTPHLAKAGLNSAVIHTLEKRNSLLVLNKASLLSVKPDDIRLATTNQNIVAADPLDGRVDPEVLSQCSLLIASSLLQFDAFRHEYPSKPSIYVAHHVDIRIPAVVPPSDRLRMAYFGEIANAGYNDKLAKVISFISTNTRDAGNAAWMSVLPQANAHFALRRHHAYDGLKPFTKGFIAAHCGCPVLADIQDEEAFRHLTRDYPYFVDSSTFLGVALAIERMRKDFRGAEWKRASEIMQTIRSANSREAIAARFVDDLLGVKAVAQLLRSG